MHKPWVFGWAQVQSSRRLTQEDAGYVNSDQVILADGMGGDPQKLGGVVARTVVDLGIRRFLRSERDKDLSSFVDAVRKKYNRRGVLLPEGGKTAACTFLCMKRAAKDAVHFAQLGDGLIAHIDLTGKARFLTTDQVNAQGALEGYLSTQQCLQAPVWGSVTLRKGEVMLCMTDGLSTLFRAQPETLGRWLLQGIDDAGGDVPAGLHAALSAIEDQLTDNTSVALLGTGQRPKFL
ncbi:protein phosphatase 2C domain-containing protein [Limnohabitans radicicola]|uniref:Protein phosphatase 2C domain-containing protein n=1 Tax=Limnohabitans radicicola TaxID=2771427 RepID=A0A927FJ88_9BURK|nr:protein phosphatase 2C domain-containing protein [Limnohabitans radicicola]MBD8051976.1 protein phosphatase 2C domain-containing protein [Limnohabitans radicicola]